MPGDAAPAFDAARGLFVEPYSPHEVIGVMHLAGREQKTHRFRLNRLDGGTVETSLRYGESRAFVRPAGDRRRRAVDGWDRARLHDDVNGIFDLDYLILSFQLLAEPPVQ